VGVPLRGRRHRQPAPGRVLRACRDIGQRPGHQHRAWTTSPFQACLDPLPRHPHRRHRPLTRAAGLAHCLEGAPVGQPRRCDHDVGTRDHLRRDLAACHLGLADMERFEPAGHRAGVREGASIRRGCSREDAWMCGVVGHHGRAVSRGRPPRNPPVRSGPSGGSVPAGEATRDGDTRIAVGEQEIRCARHTGRPRTQHQQVRSRGSL